MIIRRFYLYRIFGQFLPMLPVYLLMFQQRGLSLASISLLLIMNDLPCLLMEVPSSILADHWNRKKLMVISKLLKALVLFIWLSFTSFIASAIGFLLWGLSLTLCSGTEQAWLYDTLKVQSKEDSFDRVWGKVTFYSVLTIGIASAVGSIIAAYSMKATLIISIFFTLCSAVTAATLPECNLHIQQAKINMNSYWDTLKNGVSFCFRHSIIYILIGINVTILIAGSVLEEYDPLFVSSIGVPLVLIGFCESSRYIIEALGGRLAWKIKALLNKLGIRKAITIQLLLCSSAGVVLAIVSGFSVIYILPLLGLFYFIMSVGGVLFTDALQSEIQDEGRATVQSLSAMFESPFAMMFFALMGISGKTGIRTSMIWASLWILAFCVLFWILIIRQNKKIGNASVS